MALIALQTPVATDLRVAIALVHCNDRIARMGAQCTVIARLCEAMPADARLLDGQRQCLTAMADVVDRQLRDVATVFRDRDPDGAC